MHYSKALLFLEKIEAHLFVAQNPAITKENLETTQNLLRGLQKKLPASASVNDKVEQDSIEQCITSVSALLPLLEALIQVQDSGS
jgi:hypothetical protein